LRRRERLRAASVLRYSPRVKSAALLGLVAGCTFSVKLDGASEGPAADARVDIDAPSIDAALVDAVLPVDANPPMPTWVQIETLSVPCTGTEVVSTTLLQPNTTYRLRASGQCIANTTGPSRADAEYAAWNYTTPSNSPSGIDLGLAVNDTTPGGTKLPDWGSLRGVARIHRDVDGPRRADHRDVPRPGFLEQRRHAEPRDRCVPVT
jgi:hypothetical protein